MKLNSFAVVPFSIGTISALLSVGAVYQNHVEAIRIIGLAILVGVISGCANYTLVARECNRYLTWDHKGEYTAVRSLNPTLNGVVWGVSNGWFAGAVIGSVLAAAAQFPAARLHHKITMLQLAPFLCVGAGLIFATAHLYSLYVKHQDPDNEWIALQAHGWTAFKARERVWDVGIGLVSLALVAAIATDRLGHAKIFNRFTVFIPLSNSSWSPA